VLSHSITRSNIRHLYADIFWFGILSGSAMTFLNVYAARLGASAMQIGLLTAGPAVVNLVISLPAGGWLERQPLIPVSYWTSLISRLFYIPLIFLPFLFNQPQQILAMIWITLAMSLPAAFLAISFNALLAGVVPADQRSDVVGRRNALLAISMIVSTLVSGQILDLVSFPLNYQIVFGIGAFGALMSSYHLGRLRLADPQAKADNGEHRSLGQLSVLRKRLPNPIDQPFLRLPGLKTGLLRGPYGLFMVACLTFYTFQYLCLPLFPLAYVNDLQLTDGMISLGSSLFYVTMFLISLRIGRLARHFGNRALLAVSAMSFSLYPFFLGIADGPVLFWVASLAGGVVWGVISASLINRLIERVPGDQPAAGMALHNLALNLGILVGSLSGPLLGEALGIQPALLVGSGLRFLAGVLLLFWG
jgi:MFS family permease